MSSKPKSFLDFIVTGGKGIEFWLGPHLLAKQGTMIIYGAAEAMKSWLAIDLAFALVDGMDWLGRYKTSKCKVMVIQVEQAESVYAGRFLDYMKLHRLRPGDYEDRLSVQSTTSLNTGRYEDKLLIESWIKDFKPDVVIVDCLYQLLGGGTDDRSMKEYTEFMSKMQNDYGIAVVTLHHPRKHDRQGGEDYGLEEMRGSGILGFWVDTSLFVVNSYMGWLSLEWMKQKNAKRRINGQLRVNVSDKMEFKIQDE